MATELGQAYVQIMPSAKGIGKSLGDVISGPAESSGQVAGEKMGHKMISAFKNIIVAAGVGKIIKDAIFAGGDLEQSIGGVETLFKDSSETVIAYANEAYKTAGVSANDYMENVTSFSASLLQSLGGDTEKAAGVAHTAMVDMSDNANKMGTNMQDIQNAYQGFAKQNYTMLDNLKLGYGGTKSEMERLLADAQELTGVEYNIDNLSDVYNAIHAIQENLEITGTTALEAEETFSGSLNMMKAAWQNVLAEISTGGEWDMALSGLTESVLTFAKNLLPMVGDTVRDLPLMLINLIRDAGPGLITAGMDMISNLVSGLGLRMPEMMARGQEAVLSMVQAIIESLPALLDAGLKMVTGLATGILDNITTLTAALPTLIMAIVDFIVSAIPQIVATGVQLLSALVEALPTIIQNIVTAIPQIIDGIVGAITTLLPMMFDAGIQMFTGLIGAIDEIIPIIVAAIPLIVDGLVAAISDILPVIIEAGIMLLTSLVEALPQIITTICDAIPVIIDSIIGAIDTLVPLIIDAGVDLLVSLVAALPEIIAAIVPAIPTIISAILSAIIELIPVIIDAGIQLLVSLVEDLPTIIQAVVTAIPTIISALTGKIGELLPQMAVAGLGMLISIITKLPEAIVRIVSAIPQIVTGLVKALASAIPQMAEAGLNLIKGLWQGIINAKDWLMSKISGFVDSVVGGFKNLFGIHSPSSVMADEIGEFLPSGVAVGAENNMKPMSKAMEKLSDVATGSFESELAMRATMPSSMDTLTSSVTSTATGSYATNKKPLVLTLILGGQAYKAFVDDITNEQERAVNLALSY